MFQSLSGFLGLCNLVPPDHPGHRRVSIPIGFSRALQPCPPSPGSIPSFSFNPYRVFSGSATTIAWHRVSEYGSVSIPIGFSRALQHNGGHIRLIADILFQSLSGFLGLCNGTLYLAGRPAYLVSIPIGFSRALQPRRRLCSSSRVNVFQSLSGFLGLCNQVIVGLVLCLLGGFQSLSGFLGLCNLPSHVSGRRPRICFNPYRVFSGSATSRWR